MEQVAGDKMMTEGAFGYVADTKVPEASTSVPMMRSKPMGQSSKPVIASVLQYWKTFDLDSKRVMLDTQGTTMKAEKDSSLRSRKKLAETTKSFRKLGDADKVNGMGSLLRAYQEEIDNLTRRAKYSENAFFMLYKELSAAPDPVPVLESIHDTSKTSSSEGEELKRLKRELHEYEVEFSTLKNQDITIRKLEDQLYSMERDMEDVVHKKAGEKCRELEEQLQSRTMEYQQHTMDLERQLEHGRQELHDAFNRLDALQSELFAYKQRSGLAKTALDAEMQAISQEAIMMQTMRLENTQLKKQLDELLGAAGDSSSFYRANIQNSVLGSSGSGTASATELSKKEAVIANLRQEVLRLKDTVSQLEGQAMVETARHQELLQQAKRIQDDLTAQLAARPTMDKFNDVLHQLRILQQLEYNIVDENSDTLSTSAGGSSSETDATHSTEIEKILVSRVRRLEHSLQQHDLTLQQKLTELQECQRELGIRQNVIEEQAALLRNLEESVASMEKCRSSSISIGGPMTIGAEILNDAMEGSATSDGNVSTDSKMFEIVRGQRDRFRERMKELQADKNKLEEVTVAYKAQVTRLENDNLQLYQKIRYLQSYRAPESTKHNSGINIRITPGNGINDLENGSMDVESKYKSMYDDKMNPFQQFNKMENQQRYGNLNTVDKILLNSAKLFLGHRITRNIGFAYIVLLHFLVVATLYSFMHGCGTMN